MDSLPQHRLADDEEGKEIRRYYAEKEKREKLRKERLDLKKKNFDKLLASFNFNEKDNIDVVQ